jgi:hypothetical protein
MTDYHFFGTPSDLRGWLEVVESEIEVNYIKMGNFEDPVPVVIPSLARTDNLGIAINGNSSSEPAYLAFPPSLEIHPERYELRKGGVRYSFDQRINPKTIEVQPCGVYQDVAIVVGRIATVAPKDPDSKALLKAYSKRLRSMFTKVDYAYVGDEAMTWLKDGRPLVTYSVRARTPHNLKPPQ